MSFMNWIIEELENIALFFYDAYQEVKDWYSPFDLLKYPLYGIYGGFHWLAEFFTDFRDWLDWAADQIDNMLTSSYIFTLLKTWLDWAEDAWYWVRYAINNVTDIIANWWSGILPYILTRIDNAVEGLASLIEAWDTFWTITWPDLVSFDWLGIWWNSRLLDIDALIDTWSKDLAPFWEGWQDVREEVINFFADPLQWAYDKLDEFFERFW